MARSQNGCTNDGETHEGSDHGNGHDAFCVENGWS
jgi:hypothetical protein